MPTRTKPARVGTAIDNLLKSMGNGIGVVYRYGRFEVCQFDPKGKYRNLTTGDTLSRAIQSADYRRCPHLEGTLSDISGRAIIEKTCGHGIGQFVTRSLGREVERIRVPVRLTHQKDDRSLLPGQDLIIEPVPGIKRLLKMGVRLRFEGWFVTSPYDMGCICGSKIIIGGNIFDNLEV